MNKASHPDISDRIAAVERRLERRRVRLLDDLRETKDAASRSATKVVPIAAALGAGLVALYFTRRATSHRPPPTYSEYRRHVDRYEDPPRRGLRWAQVAGILGTAIRIGASPQARAFWHGYQRARERRRYGRY
jgi:hypothetical protein